MKTIDDLGELRGKRVLVRSDFNVPLDGTTITDDGRIRAALPTIRRLTEAGARVVVTAHLGRPKGAVDPAFSLAPVSLRLGELLGTSVTLATDTVGEGARHAVAAMHPGDVVLLENIRFDPRETSKEDAERASLADDLAALADIYVSDGFGVVHRKQASVYDVALELPHAVGGLVQTELEALGRATESPERPYAVVLGGRRSRQARSDREPAHQGRSAAHRWRDGLHVPRGAGALRRFLPARGGPGRDRQEVPGGRC